MSRAEQVGTDAEPQSGRRVATIMASRIRTAWEERSPVASELEAIFAPLPRLVPAAVDARAPAAARANGLRLWFALLGVIALASLVGSLAFLTPIAWQPALPRHVVRAAPAPTPIPPATATGTPPPIVHREETRQPASRVAPKASPTRPQRAAPPPAHHGRCPRFASEAWCLHGTITASDNDLRDAYDAAVRAGVDRDVLVSVRSDWNRLRGRANRDPQALIRGYAILTQELRAETREAQ